MSYNFYCAILSKRHKINVNSLETYELNKYIFLYDDKSISFIFLSGNIYRVINLYLLSTVIMVEAPSGDLVFRLLERVRLRMGYMYHSINYSHLIEAFYVGARV